MRLFCWKQFIPYYFALNKVNYACYGSYYVEILKNIEKLYPGIRQVLSISVQAQDKYPLRTPTDQRGGQTINRDAKTSGGIKKIAKDSSAVIKWCLNRAEQAKTTSELLAMSGVNRGSSTYKPLRPSKIIKSERLVQSVIHVTTQDYINPFDENTVSKESCIILVLGDLLTKKIQ